jgi:hypothetical protein
MVMQSCESALALPVTRAHVQVTAAKRGEDNCRVAGRHRWRPAL